jgi:hypothetical protein
LSNYKRTEEHRESCDSGIYCILNKINGKRYIGQTYSLRYRKSRHFSDLKNNRHANNHIQASFNKYGISAFEYKILEYCNLDIIDEREKYWIEYYDVIDNGYNQCDGGLGCRGYKHTSEEIEKMRAIQNPKKVIQLDMDLNIVKVWQSSSQAAKTLSLYSQAIKNCCEKKNRVKSVGGYVWIYEEDYNFNNLNYYIRNISFPKPVNQYDMQMNFIKTWNSAYEAQKCGGFTGSEISNVCHGKKKSHKGFIFKFKDECNN